MSHILFAVISRLTIIADITPHHFLHKTVRLLVGEVVLACSWLCRRWRQEDQEFQASFSYIASPRLAWAIIAPSTHPHTEEKKKLKFLSEKRLQTQVTCRDDSPLSW